jgi:hypothetical protein
MSDPDPVARRWFTAIEILLAAADGEASSDNKGGPTAPARAPGLDHHPHKESNDGRRQLPRAKRDEQ